MILAAVTKVSYKHGLWIVARVNYCKYIIFAEGLPLPSLTVQNTNPSLSLPLLFSFGCITIISNNCQIIIGAATVMDKKSVTPLTLKQINKRTVYQ